MAEKIAFIDKLVWFVLNWFSLVWIGLVWFGLVFEVEVC